MLKNGAIYFDPMRSDCLPLLHVTAPQGSQRVQPGLSRQQPSRQNSDHRLRSRYSESDLSQLLCLKGESDAGNELLYTLPLCVIGVIPPAIYTPFLSLIPSDCSNTATGH